DHLLTIAGERTGHGAGRSDQDGLLASTASRRGLSRTRVAGQIAAAPTDDQSADTRAHGALQELPTRDPAAGAGGSLPTGLTHHLVPPRDRSYACAPDERGP